MIQRIQSLYLLLATAIISLLYFFPMAEYNEISGNILVLDNKGIVNISENMVLINYYSILILIILTTLISIISIFLFKNRKLQMRLTIYNVIVLIGMFGLIYYYYKIGINEVIDKYNIEIISKSMSVFSLSPVIASFFNYLAYKRILRDEILVKSIDRIR